MNHYNQYITDAVGPSIKILNLNIESLLGRHLSTCREAAGRACSPPPLWLSHSAVPVPGYPRRPPRCNPQEAQKPATHATRTMAFSV